MFQSLLMQCVVKLYVLVRGIPGHPCVTFGNVKRSPTVQGCSGHLVKSGSPWGILYSYKKHNR